MLLKLRGRAVNPVACQWRVHNSLKVRRPSAFASHVQINNVFRKPRSLIARVHRPLLKPTRWPTRRWVALNCRVQVSPIIARLQCRLSGNTCTHDLLRNLTSGSLTRQEVCAAAYHTIFARFI